MGIYERIFGSDDDLQYDDPYIVGDGEDYTPSYIKDQRPIKGKSTANIISEGIDQFGQAVVEDPVGVAKAVGTGIYESGKEFVQNPVETTTDFVTGVGESIYNVGTKSLTDYLPEGLDEESASEEQMTQARQDRLNDFLNASVVVPAAGAGITGAKALANAMPDVEFDPNTVGMNMGNIKFKSPATVASQTEDLFSGADIAEIAAQGDMRVPYADPTFGPTGRISTRVPKVGTKKTGGERPDPSVYGGELTINKDVMDEAGTTEKNMEFLASGREQSTDVNRKGQLIMDPENNPYQNIGDVPYFPGFKVLEGMSPEDRAKFVSAMQKENLEWVMDKLPKNFQDRAKLWYTGANRFSEELSNKFGIPRASVSGVIAALSPQKDWFQNASMAERVLDAAINNRTFPWSTEMTAVPEKYGTFLTGGRGKNREIWESIKGKSYDQLETIPQKAMWIRAFDEAHNPKTYRALTPEGDLGEIMIADTGKPATVGWGSFNEIEKAVAAMESGGDFKILSDAMGGAHKVRNFFNNIEVPFSDMGDVTIDTHAIAAALMRPLAGDNKLTKQGLGLVGGTSKSFGTRGNYGFIADDYREVASNRGLLPREVQSITWEGVRGLFNNKSDSNKRAVNTIWSKVDSGELTQQQALDLIESAMGGFADTTWINEPRPKRSIAGGASTMFNKGGYVAPAEGEGFASPK